MGCGFPALVNKFVFHITSTIKLEIGYSRFITLYNNAISDNSL